MKFLFSIVPKTEKISIPSPVKEKADAHGDRTVADVVLKPQWLSPGSKDESFFDSQPWMESDCEDDYYSVKGDFTPSRGSTPVHHSFSLGNLLVNKAPSVEGNPSPPDKRKRLSELFKEHFREDAVVAADNKNEALAKVVPEPTTDQVHEPKSTNCTPFLARGNSGRSSAAGRTPNMVLRAEDKSVEAQCCLPRLLLGYRFKERKKAGMSPANSG